MGAKNVARHRLRARGVMLACVMLIVVLLSACSAGSSSGSGFSLGLSGSTTDHPATPPVIAANGPAGAYAFVYDNQIWLRRDGENQATQLTQMTFSTGSNIVWGPLVWSPDGRYIAFTVVEILNPVAGSPTSGIGPLYYLDTLPYPATLYLTAGTGSTYGHSYTWFGNSMLLYANGGGIQMYPAGVTNPRAWEVIGAPSAPQGGNGQAVSYAFGDIQVSSGDLYYTRDEIRSPGAVGAVGTATIVRSHLGLPSDYTGRNASALANLLPLSGGQLVTTLGLVYAASGGAFVAGVWQIAGSQLAVQRIQRVDTAGGNVTSQLCMLPTAALNDTGCDSSILPDAGVQPIEVRPQLAFGGSGKIAYNGDGLYLVGAHGDSGHSGWPAPPAWSPDGRLALTQIVSTQVDASGVTRTTTAIVLFDRAGQRTVLIDGARNIAWQPTNCATCTP